MHKAVAFCRRSTEMQTMSLADQKTLLTNWIKSAQIIQDLKIDPNKTEFIEFTGTGTKIGAAFEDILEQVRTRTNDFSFIIVEKLDRLHGRMGDKLLPYLRELKDNGVSVITTDTGTIRNHFDNMAENVHTYIDLEVGREESRKMATRGIDRGKVKAAEGWWQGGTPPLGYARMEYSSDGKQLGTLKHGEHSREGNRVRPVLDGDSKIEAARHVFSSYINGESLRNIVGWLNTKGFTTARGNKWSRTVLKNMLNNPIYRGDHTWGKRKSGIFSREENIWRDHGASWSHDEKNRITHHDESLRIISDEVFYAVKTKMESNTREYSGEKRPDKFALLDKLVYCENCDSRYYYREEPRGNYLLKRYRDYGKNRSVNCKRGTIQASILHEYAEELVFSETSPELIHEGFDRAREIIVAESGLDITLEKSLSPEINRLEAQERNLVKILKDAPNSKGLIIELQKVCDQLEQLRNTRDQINRGEIDSDSKALNRLEKQALSFREIWIRGSAQNRQRVAKAFIKKVEISTDRSTATWDYLAIPAAVCRIECRGRESNPHILAETGF